MAFNELNSVENYIINQLSGVNLNDIYANEYRTSYGSQWVSKAANDLGLGIINV